MIPERGLRIGRVFGIDIYIHWTWLLVFCLLLWAIISFFHVNGRSDSPYAIPIAVVTTLLFFLSVLLHEISHSLVANRNGVPIRRITLFVFGGVAQMSKDVTSPGVELKMAAAGPLASYVLAVTFGGLAFLADYLGMGTLAFGLVWLAVVNIGLGTFNLLPGFPLDGGRIFRSILWHSTGDLERSTRIASYAGMGMGMLLIAGGLGLMAADMFMGKTDLLISGVWFIFIGVFLYSAATAGYRQARLRSRISHLEVGGAYRRGVPAADVFTSLEEVYQYYMASNPRAAVPVLKQGRLYGVLYSFMLTRVPRERWSALPAEAVARPVQLSEIIDPRESLYNAYARMEKDRLPFLWVVEDGRLLGVLLREDLQRISRSTRALENGQQAAPALFI